jgi:8-oxo-dGTP pyrophosphatase MutT (NUDIX family)
MDREQRISAGAIVIQNGAILLVPYRKETGENYLVSPGGGVLNDNDTVESITEAVVRETREETGLEVSPSRINFVEDLLYKQYRIVKIWFLCELVGGKLERTQGAIDEGIVEANWYHRALLSNETVYPSILLQEDWNKLISKHWETKYLGLSKVRF